MTEFVKEVFFYFQQNLKKFGFLPNNVEMPAKPEDVNETNIVSWLLVERYANLFIAVAKSTMFQYPRGVICELRRFLETNGDDKVKVNVNKILKPLQDQDKSLMLNLFGSNNLLQDVGQHILYEFLDLKTLFLICISGAPESFSLCEIEEELKCKTLPSRFLEKNSSEFLKYYRSSSLRQVRLCRGNNFDKFQKESFEELFNHQKLAYKKLAKKMEEHSPPAGVRQIAYGSIHSIEIKDNGYVYTRITAKPHMHLSIIKNENYENKGQFGPCCNQENYKKAKDKGLFTSGALIRAKQVSCGNDHNIILDFAGTVWGFGSNQYGQLGQKTKDSCIKHIVQVNLPRQARQVACGGEHTVVLLKNGDVYSFGNNHGGQLGRKTEKDFDAAPGLVVLQGKAKQVACGSEHTVVIMENGEVYSFGANYGLQLGRVEFVQKDRPKLNRNEVPGIATFPGNKKAIHVVCGATWNKFLLEDGIIAYSGTIDGKVRKKGSSLEEALWLIKPDWQRRKFNESKMDYDWEKAPI